MVFKRDGFAGWTNIKRNASKTPALGARELEVMEILWRNLPLTAHQIHEEMTDTANIALNTVQSTIERLFRKKLLSRTKEGRAYFYEAIVTKPQLISNLLRDISLEIAGGEIEPMISGFIDFVDEAIPEQSPTKEKVLEQLKSKSNEKK
ncbi:MAG: BlaI/MecI/CopY family transcriptional regulator [Pseudomonadales bacterium]|nr:BlaI/MecI/CopY family transcriptional regulator [Pseudomonadales bacterium]